MAMDSFADEWKFIKKNFEKTTAKKKPSDKFLGVFNKPSGITPASVKLDKAIDAGKKDDAAKALEGFTKTCKAYQQTLAKAAIAEKDRTVSTGIKVMIGEISHLMTEAEKTVAGFGSPPKIDTLSQWVALMKHKIFSPRITECAKKNQCPRILLFLGAMAKKDYSAKTYDTFIKDGARFEINIGSKLRKEFDPNDLDSAPWAEATGAMVHDFNEGIIKQMVKR